MTQSDKLHIDAMLDEALRESFPASDPIAISITKEAAITSAERKPGESTIFGGQIVFVEQLLPEARARLVMIKDDAPGFEAARLLRAGTDLVVVCGHAGDVVGVITKTDVVACISECAGAACTTAASQCGWMQSYAPSSLRASTDCISRRPSAIR